MTARMARAVAIGALMLLWPTASPAQSTAPAPSPAVTPPDRQSAFPDVTTSPVQDNAVHSFVLFDRFEWQALSGRRGPSWEVRSWIGRDLDRFWFRAKGEGENGRVGEAEVHALYGRALARWWDLVAGMRQDLRPGPAQTWAAVGLQGLAPYWFDVEATAYVGAHGRTQIRFETKYELLFTNRLILQPLVEANLYGKSDPDRGVGAGLGTTEIGLRLRYLVRREFAPYVGVTWNRKHFGTADLAKSAGEPAGGARLTIGLRLWR
jgi:copper resistance protein B